MTEFKYLYINSFKWLSLEESYGINGHPASGRVYRAEFNHNDKSYGIVVEEKRTKLLLDTLQSAGEPRGYTCDVVEISLDNILNLDIKLEDLKQINAWIESGNQDIVEEQNDPVLDKQLIPIMSFVNRSIEQAIEDRNQAADSLELLMALNQVNSIHFEIVSDLIETLIEMNSTEIDDVSLTTPPTASLAKSLNGMGWNIGKVYEALERYSGPDRRSNEYPEDLTEAMVNIVKELERRVVQELD
jgi:hypothetical protein